MTKGQVTVETMIMITILLFFFIVSLGILGQINWSQQVLESQAREWNECNRIAGIIQEVFVQGPGTQIQFQSENDLDVSNTFLYVGEMDCGFAAAVQPVSLTSGSILVSNSTGRVILQNE
ncbi:hypothetical protein KKE06_03850 [Candidatus Micrarchaeota archaeon]|nr:hypothetical protein [Candidatus Micrarchaeota archaeon]MBU1930647.1 hypothetical protein [Candidatus Micrarchaeota archaeon]